MMADYLKKSETKAIDVYEIQFDHFSSYLVPAHNMNEAVIRAAHYIGPKANISKVEKIRTLALIEVS